MAPARLLRAALASALVLAVASPASAEEAAPPIAPGGFRIEVPPGTSITVPGHGRFIDTIEVLPTPDGRLQVVNELSLDAYVQGLAEMPAGWHPEALKAQAVAARTYAWWTQRRGYYLDQGLDFDICGTTACQVFHGREIVETPGVGPRWAQAVADTAGQVLSYEDAPILARFFSSSGGGTRNNEHVFPSSGPRPYLQAVEDPDDAAASPLAQWQVRFSRSEMDQVLARGARLAHAVPAVGFERVLADGEHTDLIQVTRNDGHVVEVEASDFRSFVSETAPVLFPGRFPQQRADGGRMPATLPSSRLEFEVTDTEVVVHGFGWGHGVGMSQYGAKGKAERGLTHDQILAAYYRGATLSDSALAPERIRVGLTWEATDVTVIPDGDARVMTPDREGVAVPGVPWTFGASDATSVNVTAAPDVAWQPRTSATRRLPGRPEDAPVDAAPGDEEARARLRGVLRSAASAGSDGLGTVGDLIGLAAALARLSG